MAFEFPESVHRYLTDTSVRAGVDSLADVGLKKLPAGLDWSEIPQFYRALLASQQVQIEWAVTLEALWREVWPDAVPGWNAVRPDEQSVEYDDVGVSVHQCWTEHWWGRCFTKAGTDAAVRTRKGRSQDETLLCLGVMLSPEGLAVGYSIEGASGTADLASEGFHYDHDREGWWTTEQKIEATTFELSLLKLSAADVIQKVPSLTT